MSQRLFIFLLPFVLVACAGGGGGGGSSSSSGSTRTLLYTSASAFETSEYSAQSGLTLVKASSMYYNGHYRWYAQNGGTAGNPSESTAGTGVNIIVAVADTGINSAEASTGSQISINSNSYDYVQNISGSTSDPNGHGTHVAGLIAAPMNSSGMHGIAYNASILNLRIGDSTGAITATDAQIGASATRAYNAGAYIINNSWGSTTTITSVTASQLNAAIPNSIAGYQSYVANGGVAVWAAGNSGFTQVSYQAGLPYRISGLQAGWLAVAATDSSGTITNYSNRCGVSAAWCLAAPGGGDNSATNGLYSMYNNGSYTKMSGTSMAAPLVSGAIAGLKSMFPNLSYQDIAARLLTTANKTGIWADSTIYGQGLMDLEAASNPVGGLSLPTGSHTSGSSGSVSISKITLPSSVASSMRNSKILLVDSYQKAPFWVSASNFVQESKIQSDFAVRHMATMSEPMPVNTGDEEGIKFNHLQGLHSSVGLNQFGHSFAFSSGIRSDQSLSKQLNLHYLPHLNDSATNTNGFGYATNFGKTKIAMMGSMPNTQSGYNANELTQNRSMMGSRTSYSFVSQREHENFAYGLTYSLANSFTQPLGLNASGVFGLSNAQASSLGSFYSHSLFNGTTKFRTGVEMASFNASSTGLTSFDSGKYAVFKVGADHFLSKQTTLSIGFKQEQAMSGQLNTKLSSTIDSSGNIGYQNYSSGFSNFINSSQVNFDVHHRLNAVSRIKGGLMYEQRPYGLNGAGAAFFYEHRL
ncbi:S8 family peptidase [Polynucleobacter sp. UK-Mo-2m-Kol15]|uniref:S8 family peptidase n=1 Tax=Polynucleobacter sp. UK-Mo-2m-Kol15 TaxID=2576916 RepID=UPI001C0E0EC1|nr:S8 family peptidase [Polynucleobacter sp. UK-Mo-2m-Kol15]MBU3575757.1 S8 family serine peptidase [Polynucleobacter sp. UK-Mo-2m-Kol15]